MEFTSDWEVSDRMSQPFDEIGYWSEIKLDIVKEYAQQYTTILQKQKEKGKVKEFVYIDAFAGAGYNISRTTGEFVLGSPLNALLVQPKFDRYYFIDLSSQKVAELKAAVKDRDDVVIFQGDCNAKLLQEVFPHVRYEEYCRGLCLLDPYGLHLSWDVIFTAGQMRSIDMFLNFPVMDMNRNVLWVQPKNVSPEQARRLTEFWGDESWRNAVYRPKPDLFDNHMVEKVQNANERIANAFRERLKRVAGFANVPEPLPMRNSVGATVYYLFFASQKAVANKIVAHIFKKYANRDIKSA